MAKITNQMQMTNIFLKPKEFIYFNSQNMPIGYGNITTHGHRNIGCIQVSKKNLCFSARTTGDKTECVDSGRVERYMF